MRLGVGPTTQPCKTKPVTETEVLSTISIERSRVNASLLGGRMIGHDESPREVMGVNSSLLEPKHNIKIGTWNVRTMWEPSKTAQVLKEMERYCLDILGVSECRWTGSGRITNSNGSVTIYSGHESIHTHGVGLIISKEKVNTLIEWDPISPRLIKARFFSKYCKLTILQCYAPTNEADSEEKADWYEQLQSIVSQVPQHDMLLIIGDLNSKVGSDNTSNERVMGTHGCGIINENGEKLIDFCATNNYVIGGTIFPHKSIHKLTWRSPDGRTSNQIDHIIINGKWRRSLHDVKVCRGADIFSDHHLVRAVIRLKLRKFHCSLQKRKHLDITKLKSPPIRNRFVLDLRNRFSVLADSIQDDTPDIDSQWESFKTNYVESATKVLGFKQRNKKDWITTNTWEKILERKHLKVKMISTKSSRLQSQIQEAYRKKNKEVQRSVRRDKRAFVDGLAEQAEGSSINGNLSALYKITKLLCGNNKRPSIPILDKHGRKITTERQEAARWVEHFQQVLNWPEPDEPAYPTPASDTLDINVSPPTFYEVECAIKSLKTGKAAGIDSIHAEMLKADLLTSTEVLTGLFQSIWNAEKIPYDWTKGLIVKIPKKGNLQKCDSWRGITLLSIPSKVFCRVILDRISVAIDTKLREEQAGFRKGRGCMDQIFALRNIIEQCIEWNVPLFINFIDFKKAFDSIHRETLWRILHSYGIPHKIVSIVMEFYEHFECSIMLGNTTSEWFKVKSGVRQGCILSPILFLTVIDWSMRQTTADKHRGIQWTLFSQLEDLDFADDLAILSTNPGHLQQKTDRLSKYAKQTGLTINTTKTEVMAINTNTSAHITINDKILKSVDEFVYLGSLISNDKGTAKDIQRRLGQARGTFAQLHNIWRSNIYSLRTKIRLFKTLVRPVLLYGAECWRMTKLDLGRVSAFHNRCLRRICRIFWPNIISDKDLYIKTGCSGIGVEIKRRRLKLLGHVLRMPPSRIPKVALKWTPAGKRRPGRPRTTWRRTVGAELGEMGLSWGQAEMAARDRDGWRDRTDALCPLMG